MSYAVGPNITCYDYGYLTDNQFFTDSAKCPNSDSCCGAGALCLPNRLCKKADGVLVRPSCANKPWTLQSCAQICLYDHASGFVPRVNICPDGSYCCDNDPNCCANKSGAFLSNDGVLIGFANQTTSSASSTTSSSSQLFSSSSIISSTISTTIITTTSSTPALSSASTSLGAISASSAVPVQTGVTDVEPSLSVSAKAGIGIGVSFGCLILVALGFLIYLMRRRHAASARIAPVVHYQYYSEAQKTASAYAEPVAPPYTPYGSNIPLAKPNELAGSRSPRELE